MNSDGAWTFGPSSLMPFRGNPLSDFNGDYQATLAPSGDLDEGHQAITAPFGSLS